MIYSYESQEPTVSATGGLTIRQAPSSIYGLESDEEIIARMNAKKGDGSSKSLFVFSYTLLFDSNTVIYN